MTDAHLRHELEFVRGELRGACSLIADQEQKLDAARHEATRLRDQLAAVFVRLAETEEKLTQADACIAELRRELAKLLSATVRMPTASTESALAHLRAAGLL